MRTFIDSRSGRLTALLTFFAACLIFVVYLLSKTTLYLPLLSDLGEYNLVVNIQNVDNLVDGSRVRIAGVEVGQVETIEVQPAGARVTFTISPKYAPLHQGVRVRVGARSLVEETYLDITDGSGAALSNNTTLPPYAVKPNVQINDILASLDAPTRAAIGDMIRTSGAATANTRDQWSQILSGLGGLGAGGHDALDAVAAQNQDLRSLVRDTSTVLQALDTSQGQISTMVGNADHLTRATSQQRAALAGTMQRLPDVLDTADTATTKLTELAGALTSVARDLRLSGPDLSSALTELPDTTRNLRGLLPALNTTLDRAPDTLHRVPTFGDDVRDAVPAATSVMRDVNPMVSYLRPFGPDLAAWFANFNAVSDYTDEAGHHYFRLMPIINDSTVQSPVEPGYVGAYKNAVPPPHSGGRPGVPATGSYPRLRKDPQ